MISRTIQLLRLFSRAAVLKCTSGKAYARTPMHIEELEPRVLHSADLSPLVLDSAGGEVQMRIIEMPPPQPAVETQQSSRHEVVVVDTATPDYQKLVDDVLAQASDAERIDVVLIENGADGIAQITDTLKGMHDVDAVHIISHGADGAVQLGAATLDRASLAARTNEISAWAKALTADADVLIYGCDVAATPEGEAFVAQLANVTGADVAASDDLTGNAKLGGDWTLEYATGAIESQVVLTAQAQAQWSGTLDSTTLQATQDNTIHVKNGDNQKNWGTSTDLIVDRETNDLQRALLQFDLSSLGGVTINSAVLKLQATAIAGSLNLNVHEVTESWSEGTQNGSPGASNWTERSSGVNWTTAGGTYNATAAATLNTNATGTHSWDITALVQAWVNGSKTNNGLAIESPDGGGNRPVTYASRESGSGPQLVINYTNTAPTLDASKSPALSNVNEDAGAPSGAVGTLVSSLADLATPAGQVDNVTDSAGSNTGIAVTAADTANGAWWYSTNNGTSWNALGAVSASNARLLAADAGTRLYFQANANYNGTLANAITFRAWDRITGTNGLTADTTSVSGVTVADTFTTAVYTNNNGSASWTTNWIESGDNGSAGSGQIDVSGGRLVFDGGIGQDSSIYREADLSNTSGATLTFSFTNSVSPGSFAVQVSNNGGASYTTLDDTFASSGTPSYDLSQYASANTRIRFVVHGDGGILGLGAGGPFYVDNVQIAYTSLLSGGTRAFSTATDTASLTVNAVNDAPAGADKTVTTNEDTAYVFATADFGFTDAVDGNSLFAVKVSAPPASGSLKLNGNAVTTGQFVTAVDIAAGKLTYTPTSNVNGAGVASFTFQVQDDGGTAGGGVNLDATPRTMTVNVNAVNDAPAGTGKTMTTNEDTAIVFATSDFGFSDSTEGNSLLAVKITTVPGAGSLQLNGAAVAAGQLVTAVDIAAGKLVYTPAADANGVGYASFTFQVQDNGGVANGGVDLDPTARTMTINVTPVNDAPRGTTTTVFSLEDTPNDPFSSSLFGFVDSGDTPANNFAAVKITTLPTAGVMKYNGVAVTAGQVITVADIDAGKLTFTAASNVNGAGYASFTFQVQDDGGTTNGGVNLDPTPRTMTIDVVSVNDAPIGTSTTISTNEDTAYVFGTATFGYSDPNDNPANALSSVRIASLPGAGALTLNGFAVSVGQLISAASISGGGLLYTPAANANGASYASFTFQVRDNGGTLNGGVNMDPTPRTITIDVNPVNDAPAGANNTVTTNEDTAYAFTTGAFGFTDSVEGNSLLAVQISTLPVAGSLTLNGAAVTAGQLVTSVDIAAGRLVFTPASNANGAGYASFKFQVQDDGGTTNGGANLDPVQRTMTIDVASVNDAPTGASTTVTTLEDTAYVFGTAAFGYADSADSNSLIAVKIVAVPVSGSLLLDGGAVTAGQSISAVDIAAGKLVFTPAANANGAGAASFTFRVQDDGGTTNGGVDLDPVARTMTIDVTPVNDAPSGTSTTVTATEDTPLTLTAAAFGYSDAADANSLLDVRIGTVSGSGALTLNGAAVTAGQVISAVDIAAGRLVFTPAANANGAAYASFTFQVQDNGGTGNGGVDLDPVARTLTIDVAAVNDAPSGADRTVTTNEDTAYAFGTADFGFTDAVESNSLFAVKISALPAAGALKLNGAAVVAGQLVSAVDIAAGKLVYTPASNANGAAAASFTFQVQDDGGTTSGGINLDPVARTMTIAVTAVNDAPAGVANTVSTLEDTPFVFTAAHFGFSDVESNALRAVKISTLPGAGALTLNGVAVTAGQSVDVADIAAGKLVYTPGADGNGAGYASFGFQVQDDGGVLNGGVDLDPVARTMTIAVTAVNDAPTAADTSIGTPENAPFVFTTGAFGFSDPGDTPGNNLLAVKIETLPVPGALTLNGVAVTAGQSISAADIAAGKLVYTPVLNTNGTSYASFTFRVQDDGGTLDGGADTDALAHVLNIDVGPINHAPLGSNSTVQVLEDGQYVFDASSFGFSDTNDTTPNNLLAVKITTLPAAGTLTLNGVNVAANQFVTAADIAAGKLVYRPPANANGANYASVQFQVQDDGGTANSGVDLDPSANRIRFDVVAVNDAPSGTSATVTTDEDTPYVFGAAAFGLVDTADANALLGVKIASLPVSGALTLNGVSVTANQLVSTADIAAGKLVYTPAANANGAGHASFTFRVQDDGGTTNGGVDLDPVARTMTIDVREVNDAPSGASTTVTTNEDTAYVFSAASFGYTDPVESNSLAGVKLTSLPGAGSLRLNGGAVVAGQVVSAADIAAGRLVFTPAANANGAAYASFTFQVQDNGGTANGGVDLDPVARTMTIDVTAVNDAPAGASATVSTLEDTPYVFTAGSFGFSDGNDSAMTLYAVKVTTAPSAGSLTLNGAAVAAGQFVSAADIAAGRLVFAPAANAHGAGYASFTFQVQDSGGVTNGGVDLDPVARTLTIDVASVNDAPAGANRTVTATEDTPLVLTTAAFGFSDAADANALLSVKITTIPAAGMLKLDGVAVAAGQLVSAADIAGGKLVFTPALNANGAGYASFTFQVRDDGGTNNGGADLDGTARTLTIDVAAVNDAPAGASRTVTTNEDTPFVFTAAHFGFSDGADGNALYAVKISTLPGAGALRLDGVAVTAGQFVSAADIAAGRLVFTPAANANGAGYAGFTFRVQDDGGTGNGGVNLDAVARTMTIDVRSVNDAPAGANKTVTTNEDAPFVFGVADFGFGDAIDSNSLLAVKISTLPGAGSLTLDDNAVGADQLVSAADIAAGKLVFTPAANANGAAYASFTFRVQDDGGVTNGGIDLDPVARTMTVNVASVNDAPVGASRTVTTAEDTPYVFGAASFGFSDPDDAVPNALAAVKITTVPGAGALTLNGAAVTVGQSVSVADIVAGKLAYTPGANANGAGYASFTFQVQDDGGGANLDVTARTMTIDVTARNDAPTGTSTTVRTNEDTPLVITVAHFGYTDAVESNALSAVTLTSLPGAGALTLDGAAVVAGQLVSVADIAAGKLVFSPAANANGAGYASFTFRVQDDGGTANGGVDLDPVARTLTIDVAAVNDAPTGADATVTTAEDTPYVFSAASFGFADADDAGANALGAVTITTVPDAGALTLNGAAVTAGQSISIADIVAGKLVFSPDADANGAAYASFTFQVQDDGGTGSSGIDLDAIARTMTIDVTSVNDAPSGADVTLATNEDTPLVLQPVAFGFADTADSDALYAVKIATLPAAGALTLDGVAVAAGQLVSFADIAAGKLVFSPVANANGADYASFTFQVQDDGGTANGGTDFDAVARTMTIDVIAVNDAPAGADVTLNTNEDTPIVFRRAIFGFSDTDANTLLAVKIASLPTAGALTLDGVAVTEGQSIGVADIVAGKLVYSPAANENGAGYASFTFQVQDDGGDANGGADLDATARSVSINVASANDAPSGADATVATNEDTPFVFTTAAFGFSDADSNSLAAVKIGALPTAGALTLNGEAVRAGQLVRASDIAAGRLVYNAAANGNGAGYASFAFQVQDDGGTARGGVNLDPVARTMTIDVASVNDAPSGTSATIAANEDVPVVFDAAAFGYADAHDGNALRAVKIDTLPAAGTLTLDGVAVTAGQRVSLADLAAGKLVYTPGADAYGAAYASFTFQVQDDGGTARGGVDMDPTARTLTLDVASVNDAPTGTPNTVTTLEDTSLVFRADDFGFADTDANGFAAVKIATTPNAGSLVLKGAAVTAGQYVSVEDIAAGRLLFRPAPDANGAAYASFTFQVQDTGGTTRGGVNVDTVARSMTINVTPVADPLPELPPLPPPVIVMAPAAPVSSSPAAPAATPPASSSSSSMSGSSSTSSSSTSSTASADKGGSTSDSGSKDSSSTATGGTSGESGGGSGGGSGGTTGGTGTAGGPNAPAGASLDGIGVTNGVAAAGGQVMGGVQRLDATGLVHDIKNPMMLAVVSDGLGGLGGPMGGDMGGLTLSMASPQMQAMSSAPTSAAAVEHREVVNQLDEMRESLREQSSLEASTVAASAAASLGLSVGYVVWLLRGGVLLSTVLYSLPAWRSLDPLPILERTDADGDGDDDDEHGDDSLESLVERNNAAEQVKPAEKPADKKEEAVAT